MDRLRNAKLRLQPDKCEFLRHEVNYLGRIISESIESNRTERNKRFVDFVEN